ncbi:amino acid racemase [Clostridium novyi A str. 4552]|uniref:ornithine racemase n=1 Tax=Clostridium novyi A str. 4552 TaxID=1444289 RepID=A0A0A0I4Y5_CLONO|nr:alanine/ornithine racemase family PLP-dependent enzyme [Clostridium novyi]KGM95376.1 amino acid racemase [Clostridium novyi A str. 4552]
MSYPQLEINTKKLKHNAKVEVETLRRIGVEVMGVNKVFNGSVETAKAIVDGGMNVVAESRIDNLKKIQCVKCEKALLRSPALSEIGDVVKYADISLNSEIQIIRELSKEAIKQNKVHKVLLMIDFGDIREGIWFENKEEIEKVLSEIKLLPNIEIYGLGTNFNCYGTALPTVKNGKMFVALARELEDKLNIKFKYLSGGNCTSYHLIDKGIFPEGINHLRIGGLHQFGIEYVEGKYLDEYYHSEMSIDKYASNLYILKGEIIELNTKPTVPVGELGVDAFLKTKEFEDKGNRRRALLAFGRQDIPEENIHPVDSNLKILGQTSDHTIIDVEDSEYDYKLGDIISFEIDYTGLLAACNSPGIEKKFI